MTSFVSLSIALLYFTPAIAEPPNALGPLTSDYQPFGNVVVVDDLEIYVARSDSSSSKMIVWGHDIFGWDSGRTFELVDQLANETEYTVLLPNLFRNVSVPPPGSHGWEDSLQFDWLKIKSLLEMEGATSVGTVGTCWGAYFVMHVSVDPLVKAGFSAHPSHDLIMLSHLENEVALYEEVNRNGAAQFFCPTPQDTNHVRPGGLADIHLEVSYFEEFESPCDHGYFNRGNLSDPTVSGCVDRTLILMKQFFATYV